jgi:hypothetical protein
VHHWYTANRDYRGDLDSIPRRTVVSRLRSKISFPIISSKERNAERSALSFTRKFPSQSRVKRTEFFRIGRISARCCFRSDSSAVGGFGSLTHYTGK